MKPEPPPLSESAGCHRDRATGADRPPQGLLGASAAFERLVADIRLLARTDAPALIDGETGSGKELAARAIHYLGQRGSRPFVPVNCGAIPEALFESELFGHIRGAFTDARTPRTGLVSHAEGGTLFLDEIDTLPPKGQVVLLRFLQDRRYRVLGQSQETVSDARILAASNRCLEDEAAAGRFRSDLLYRLNILRLRVPPLRDRGDDVPLLCRHFARIYANRYDLPCPEFPPQALARLQARAWPGNVRELESAVHRMVLQGVTEQSEVYGPDSAADTSAGPGPASFRDAKAEAIASFERRYLCNVMAHTGGNVSAAARLAQTDRRALGRLLKKHGVDCDRYRNG
ncbi:sigma-54 dependent transcriptional regulator [Luteimonas kalidii]|uniref:Sigma-54 dependent transcriptional regulator n=1 Tax=Luteimonas kalidii TaxID=3042025 RepID=A0ABT6JSK5_9GAMM|nr:sigma-54 dependent transcriptional regulator [Luteimonas kalidii]MDH5833674.1 sigma-54 dependent transcriptional regulator [Luteimonas kalidii]